MWSDVLAPQVLYSMLVRWSNYKAAAITMLAYARRLRVQGDGDMATTGLIESAYSSAINALGLLDSNDQWLDASDNLVGPLPCLMPAPSLPSLLTSTSGTLEHPPSSSSGHTFEGEGFVTLRDLKREAVLFKAAVAVAQRIHGLQPRYAQANPAELFQQLLSMGLYDTAIALAHAQMEGAALTAALERVLSNLAAHCVRVQLQNRGECAPRSVGLLTFDIRTWSIAPEHACLCYTDDCQV